MSKENNEVKKNGIIEGVKEWAKKTPPEFFSDVSDMLFKDHKKETITCIITTYVMCFLCYFYEMIYGVGCPDLLCEGLRYYRNSDYSTSQARWMIRFINMFAGKNVVMPSITLILYCTMIGISVLIICRMVKIHKPLYVGLLMAVMVSFPVISHQIAYLYMALAYSFSFLAVTVGVFLARKRKIVPFILSVICFLMMMGSYQAYVGAASAMAVMMLLYDAVSEEKIGKCFASFGLTALAGLLGAIIDMPFSKLMMKIYHTGTEHRVSEFSFASIKENIGFSLKYSYVWFFSYFDDDVLARDIIYKVIFAVIIILSIGIIVIKIKDKKIAHALTALFAILVLPLSMNLILILIPTGGVRDLMRYQYVLVFAILLFLHSYIGKKIFNNLLAYVSIAMIVLTLFGNILAANCTTFMYKYCYDYAEKQALLMLEEIYEIPEYDPDKTPIVMGGAFSYTPIKQRYPQIFMYAEQEGGIIFWNNIYGMISCRYHFFMDYMGVNAEYFTSQEYLEAVQSEEYAEMPIWPEKGSIQMIGDKVVVKLWEQAPDR
ncbi:MAG: glucosyltransferase domain-containing protein [Lachnospiraceae bacterium]|nr:glucosyltransferase domain-containing protein [Lachnospiraceae bacterium]